MRQYLSSAKIIAPTIITILTASISLAGPLSVRVPKTNKTNPNITHALEARAECLECFENRDPALTGFQRLVLDKPVDPNELRHEVATFTAGNSSKPFIDPVIELTEEKARHYQVSGVGAITRLKDGKAEGTSTGFLVDSCYVVTSLHSVTSGYRDFTPEELNRNIKTNFSFGLRSDNKGFAHTFSGTVVGRPQKNEHTLNQDWAIVRLDKSTKHLYNIKPMNIDWDFDTSTTEKVEAVNKKFGFRKDIKAATGKVTFARPIAMVGVPGDRAQAKGALGLWAQISTYKKNQNGSYEFDNKNGVCLLGEASTDGMITHSCASSPGSSGSPLLYQNPNNGEVKVIGMHTSAQKDGNINYHPSELYQQSEYISGYMNVGQSFPEEMRKKLVSLQDSEPCDTSDTQVASNNK